MRTYRSKRLYGSRKRKRGPCPARGCDWCAANRQHAAKRQAMKAAVPGWDS